MKEIDILLHEKIIPLREKMMDLMSKQHPVMFTAAKAYMGGKRNKIGFQVLSGNYVVGTYTFTLEGMDIVATEDGVLAPSFDAPMLGKIKPYILVEKKDLEKMLSDQNLIGSDTLSAAMKYMYAVTIKFLE